MSESKWFEESKALRQLPSPTGVVLKVLRLTDDERSSVAELAAALQIDPALSGRVLKYANSAYVGAARPIVALRDAVAQLGSRCIRRLALGFSLVSQYGRGACQRFNYTEYWSRTLATALAAEKLSKATRHGKSDEIFVCGLLSEVGQLTLATVHPRLFDDVLARGASLPQAARLKMQREAFALDEVDVTGAMLREWGLPEEYIAAVRALYHPEAVDDTQGTSTRTVACLLRVAREIALYCTAPDADRPGRVRTLLGMAGLLGLGSATLSSLIDEAVREWREWGQLLGIPTRTLPPAALAARTMEKPRPAAADTQLYIARSRVLIADSDGAAVASLTKEVEGGGFSAITATDGQQALRLALDIFPEIVLVGSHLFGMEGLEFCRTLRKTRQGNHMHVILFGPSARDEDAVAALDAGADDYCIKPWRPRVLAARLRAAKRSVEVQRALEDEKEEARQSAAGLAVEHRRLEEQLRQAQKMEAIGRLAGGIAHDFNNHLTVISGYTQVLQASAAPGHPMRETLRHVADAVQQATALTRRLLTFSRKSPVQPRAVNLNTFIAETEMMLRRLIGANIEMVIAPGADLALTRADPPQLGQVLLNLVVNARDAMPDGGKLTISTANAALPPQAGTPDGTQAPRAGGEGYVLLSVSDTGCGMTDEVKAHIFEPFFTTKDEGKGTGLGLATVYGIVKQSGGHIMVDTRVGMGTTFRVYLPRIDTSRFDEGPAPSVAHLTRGGGVILVAEKEDGIRALVTSALLSAGYEVLEARDGQEALQRAVRHSGQIELVVTDVSMPRVDGPQLVAALRAGRSDIRALYLADPADATPPQPAGGAGEVRLLRKPFSLQEFTVTVQAALGAG